MMSAASHVELSLVIPCYNEEACLEATVPPLIPPPSWRPA